jgi:hypothetical protein
MIVHGGFMRYLPAIFLSILILLLSPHAHARMVDVCGKAQAQLGDFISKQPNSCTTVADCTTASWNPDPCQAPAIINEEARDSVDTRLLATLQQSVRESCKARLEVQPACAPAVVPLACENGQCIDARLSSASQ